MSELSKKLNELAEAELNEMVRVLHASAAQVASGPVGPTDLLRIAAGGKTQVLHNTVIKRLVDARAAELLDSLGKEPGS